MYNEQIPDPANELLNARLERIQGDLRELDAPTREDYQVAVYSKVNGVLNLGNKMQPLKQVSAEAPAMIGDLTDNLTRLNQDATDVARVLVASEDAAARLFNLAASTQNGLRQQIRELAYGSNASRFIEAFLHNKNIDEATASLDFSSGAAYLTVATEQEVKPASVVLGVNSKGDAENISGLTDGKTETRMVFNGTSLELIVTFAQPEILNRIQLEMDDYEGLELNAFTSSPDGTVFDDVLADLNTRHLVLNGTSGKLSGDVILDFPPRHVKQIRLVINDYVESSVIPLRGLSFYRRAYTAEATLLTKRIEAPVGERVRFSVVADTWSPLTTIVHQISTNGVHFQAITPGTLISIDQPFFYKATLQRVKKAFDEAVSPVVGAGMDPNSSQNYKLAGTSTVQLGTKVLERTLEFDSVSGPVTLKEAPIPGTFRVMEGAALLSESDYSFANGVLGFSAEKSNVTVTYQTSSLGHAAIAAREDYYSPVLREVRFEKA